MSYKTFKNLKKTEKHVEKKSIDLLDAEHLNLLLKKFPIIIVDAWANWCRPCKLIANDYEELAHKYPQVVFCKDDIDSENSPHKNKCEVVPTFFFYARGNIKKLPGADFTIIEEYIKELLAQ